MSRMKVEFPAVQTRLTPAEEEVLLRTLRENPTWSQGEEQKRFEQEFTSYIGCADSVAVSSCTAALELAATLLRLGPDDEVILPAHTFVSSAVPFGRTGARIVFADIDPDTRVVTADTIRRCLSPRTKAAVVVHLYGLPADMDPILELASQNGFAIVEDSAQAAGATYKGRKTGSMGDFGCFSFQTQKNMSTLGEGGMLTVRRKGDAEIARKLRWMGIWPFPGERARYWAPAMGNLVAGLEGVWPFNFCLSEAQCAVGRLLLRRLDEINEERRAQARLIRDGLREFPELVFQHVPAERTHAYHLLSARFDGASYGKTRDDLIDLLYREYNLKCIVQYWPLYRSELFQSFGFGQADVPECDRFFDNMISFPFWSAMPEEVMAYMVQSVGEAIARLRRV